MTPRGKGQIAPNTNTVERSERALYGSKYICRTLFISSQFRANDLAPPVDQRETRRVYSNFSTHSKMHYGRNQLRVHVPPATFALLKTTHLDQDTVPSGSPPSGLLRVAIRPSNLNEDIIYLGRI